MQNTDQQFDAVIALCRDIYAKKLTDYGAAWRIMRPQSVTDQLFINIFTIIHQTRSFFKRFFAFHKFLYIFV